MKKVLCFVLTFGLIICISQFADSQTKRSRTSKKISQKQILMPKVSEFGVYTFGRHSEQKDSSGMFVSPYEYGEIVNIFFHAKSKIKENVTIVPLQADFPFLDLKITKVEKSDFLDCNVEPSAYAMEIELGKINDKKWLAAEPIPNRAGEYPFDVFLIYPRVNFAKNIKPEQLKKSMLPKGVYLKTVVGAVDLTNDGKPDLLETRFCRNDKKQSAENCDYSAGELFKKIKGIWKSVKFISSCT